MGIGQVSADLARHCGERLRLEAVAGVESWFCWESVPLCPWNVRKRKGGPTGGGEDMGYTL